MEKEAKSMDKKMWVLTFSIILNVILAGAFGYGMGMIGEETPKDVTNIFYDNRTFNYNDQQYNQSYDNHYNNYTDYNFNDTYYNWLNLTIDIDQNQTYQQQPTYAMTMLEGDCYNFPFWVTDSNCATGDTEIQIDNQNGVVYVPVVVDNSDNSVMADSFAIDFVFHRNDIGWTENGTLVPTVISADVDASVESFIVYNLTTLEPVYVIKRTDDNLRAIAWTDFFGGTFISEPDGAVGYLKPGETGTATFTVYFNESELPDLEDNQGVFFETFRLYFTFTSGGHFVSQADLTIDIRFQP